MNKNNRNNSEKNESESSSKKPKIGEINNGYETPTDQKIKLDKNPYIKRRGLVLNSLQNNDGSNLEFP
jgi:hypothetical protein